MKKITLVSIAIVALALQANAQFGKIKVKDIQKAANTATSVAAVASGDMDKIANEYIKWMDTTYDLCEEGDENAARLAKVAEKFASYDGLAFNFQAYKSTELNTFACPDGSIRICTALMALLTDEELTAILAHEMGHVKSGDTKDALKTAYTSTMVGKAASAAGDKMNNSDLGNLGGALASMKIPMEKEYAADDYSLTALKAQKIDVKVLPSALRKIETALNAGGKSTSQPGLDQRATRLEPEA